MDLYVEILAHYLSQENAHVVFPNLQLNSKEIVEMQCYQALHLCEQAFVQCRNITRNV